MAEEHKKRSSSFRKLFPSLFFSHKLKTKTSEGKETHSRLKKTSDTSLGSSNSNFYQTPRSAKRSEKNNKHQNDSLYENLTLNRSLHDVEIQGSDAPSNHSSSSTLVSESLRGTTNNAEQYSRNFNQSKDNCMLAARPQVPPKPLEAAQPQALSSNSSHYPDVYYHSLEKINDRLTPFDEAELYKASRENQPASVSAEIKKVSTTFLISPKKEAEVRTIQPTRARSFSFNKDKNGSMKTSVTVSKYDLKDEKPYNYSAPTSPTPINHKIPSMPTTVSPYERVRKTLIEAEEKKNSLNRLAASKTTPTSYLETGKGIPGNTIKDNEKEKTRQKVEAFYWQKLKELKQKEDEYFLRQSVKSSRINSANSDVYYVSNCSTPNSLVNEQRSFSLPRGHNLNSYSAMQAIYTSPTFVRGSSGRRSDTFISTRISGGDPDIVYRHPEKNMVTSPISYQPRRNTGDVQYMRQLSNRMSFGKKSVNKTMPANRQENLNEMISLQERISVSKEPARAPPRPPARTTSIRNSNIIEVNKKIHEIRKSNIGYSESESGSEAGEVQRILRNATQKEEDWHGDSTRIDGGLSDGEASRGPTRGRSSRRDDPRRHTLAGNHLYVHPHHPSQLNSLDIEPYGQHDTMIAPEYATVTKYRDMKPNRILDPRMRKPPLPRYPPPSNNLLFDDDPGIMSEVETSSTGFRRGGKQRSSLPVVRTPSKTLERPLGLVFLQYRNETKRALLPNEITSIDTVKALFVRSFPKQLTMQYMDSPMVKIYIHDSSKDMFYELEDVRAHLRDIRDRSVLRLFEATDMGGGVFPGAVGVGSLAIPPSVPPCSGPSSWDQDQSYFSEPEIDSEYHHHHVHNKNKVKAPAYYMGTSAPSTLPRGGGSLLRAFSPAAPPVPADRSKPLPNSGSFPGAAAGLARALALPQLPRCFPIAAVEHTHPRASEQLYTIPGHTSEGYMSSPERVAGGTRPPYEDPYYTQFLGPAAGRAPITPVIDEETSDGVIIDDSYQMYGVNSLPGGPRPMPRPPYDARITPQVDDMQRLRVEKMERQLANLTGLVQKALQVPGAAPPAVAPRHDFQTYVTHAPSQDGARFPSTERPPKLGRDKFQKSVSFEKSVSFSDDPPDMNSPKQHSPQHSADTKPTKPAIKSSTLPRTSSQERDRLKPAPPPKPAGLAGQPLTLVAQRTYTINVSPDFINQLRVLQKQSRDLRLETRNLRRSTLAHAIQMRQLMADTIVKIGAIAASFCEHDPDSQLTREEEIYRQDMLLLENDLYELEATVERLRGQAANRYMETRVNMADIERIAMVLSKSSKTVADWKLKFPILQDTMKVKLASEMEKVVRKEKMLEEEPERLELALRRCKKLTGTLVTLKRLACVQEQRLPLTEGRVSPGSSQGSTFTGGPSSEEFPADATCLPQQPHNKGTGDVCIGRGAAGRGAAELRPENALDALLDELQTFAKPTGNERAARAEPPLRRLHSYPSGSDTDASPPVRARGQHPAKPPVPERHPELLALATRRAPPPPPPRTTSRSPLASPTSPNSPTSPRNDNSVCNNASDNDDKNSNRQALLEQRHQELLKKQKALQEQYARLQMIQRTGPALLPNAQPDLKKTGSESNLLSKMNLNLAAAATSGSMTHLAGEGGGDLPERPSAAAVAPVPLKVDTLATTNKVYETDIL